MEFENTSAFAKLLDAQDPLKDYRSLFYLPKSNGLDKIYFCGNSLGLQPKAARQMLESELSHWEELGVDGHFMGDKPWLSYHKNVTKQLALLTGALEEEVVAMGSLSNNLHLLMVSFYQPRGKKVKILVEKGAFSSDMYVVESQVQFHDLNPSDNIIEIAPRDGEYNLQTIDILNLIAEHKDDIALILLGGVNYYTGQCLDMAAIAATAVKNNIKIGYDLAHAIGNVRLALHQWQVDFAAWCTYKYLNAGPGGVAGIFVHQKYAADKTLKRLSGWWGHDENSRFKMLKGFNPLRGAEGWQLSNAPVIPLAIHQASLDIFVNAGLEQLFAKSKLLFEYLIFIIKAQGNDQLDIITPLSDNEHGSQVSMYVKSGKKDLFYFLEKNGVVLDWREPNVIRIAPVPLYNSYTEVFQFGAFLSEGLAQEFH